MKTETVSWSSCKGRIVKGDRRAPILLAILILGVGYILVTATPV